MREYPKDLYERLGEEIARWGIDPAELCASDEPLMLGYVAKPREAKGRVAAVLVGNVQVYELCGTDALMEGVAGTIAFDGAGRPMVELEDGA